MNPACDILIAGGGVTGVPAAVVAARAGMRVVLVEKSGFLGGAGVTALHRHICGLYLNGAVDPADTLNSGLPREIVSKLTSLSPSNHPTTMGRVWVLAFEPAHFRSVYETIARDEPNLTVLFSSTVKSLTCDGNLFAGGRCISATSQALASTRVMGTCMALGEAAGLQAAVFVNSQQP